MKKLLLIMTAFLLLASCANNGRTASQRANDTCHIEQYFHKFMARYPDGLNNEIKKEEMNKQFVAEITDSLRNSNWLLEDLPLSFESIQKCNNGNCYVHFQSWIKPTDWEFKDFDFNEVCFDLVGEVPSSYIDILKEGDYYVVHGRLKRFIRLSEFKLYTDEMAYTPFIGIEKETLSDTRVNWQLGMMLFDIDSISEYKPIP